jgi:hypothetical protein
MTQIAVSLLHLLWSFTGISLPLLRVLIFAYRSFVYTEAESKEKTWCMGPYAGAEYNLTLCPLQSLLQHIYHGQPYDRVDLDPMPELTLSPSQGLWIWPHLAQQR